MLTVPVARSPACTLAKSPDPTRASLAPCIAEWSERVAEDVNEVALEAIPLSAPVSSEEVNNNYIFQ